MENYFALYGLPLQYHIDTAVLKRMYLQRSRAAHPDMHTQTSSTLQDEALRQSALNNLAYKTLNDPSLRLEHLLQLAGLLQVGEASLQQQLPPAFLMEMMELNEAIDEVQGQTEAPSRAVLAAQVTQLANAHEQQIASIMQQHDATPDVAMRQQHLAEALKQHLQRKYVLRLKARL